MARRITINRLDKDELTYELTIRGIGTGTCEEMRHRLALALQMEKSGDSLHYPDYPYTFETDEIAVRKALAEAGKLIDDLTGPKTSGEAVKIQTKLAHILSRIDKMDSADETTQSTRKSELLGMALTMMHKFWEKLDSDKDDGATQAPAALTHLEARLESCSFNANVGGAAQSSVLGNLAADPVSSGAIGKMIPPHKWNLRKFCGDGKSMSVTAFFEGVEELRLARHVTKAVLLDSGVDLFADKAYQFYKDCRTRVTSWDELVQEFKEEYLSANHADALFEELQKRTQHPSETIGVYLAVMSSYFSRLGCPTSEEVKLSIVMKNLHPFYQDRLRDPLPISLAELRVLCRRMESRRDIINGYVEPPSRRANVMEKDLAYVDVAEEISALEVATSQVPAVDHTKQTVCFRCNKPGHRAIGCALPKRLQCYGCKKEGFTLRNCPNCADSGNGRRRP
ncbi:hypothetical protein JTB14_032477 [Gonioctena quinquepunctata]|nr:hypothetical protein JTB14_032477 [Gonioctena quinquepunctata]